MRRIYTVLLYLSIPFILARLYWKGRKLPLYRTRIKERFGFNTTLSRAQIWLHAVSLGEVIAATPLIEALLQKGYSLLVTTMTPTGSLQVQKRFGKQVQHQYLPYDFPFCIRLFLKKCRPKIGLIMETELWPNLIFEAQRLGIPLFLLNARLSDKSFQSYMRLKWFFAPILQKFAGIFSQSDLDQARFIAIGAPVEKVKMLGNIKFDLAEPSPVSQELLSIKERWGKNRPTLILASTHDNEEEQWLNHLKSIQQNIPNLLLLIAPRHPERFKLVYELVCTSGFLVSKRSEPHTINRHNEVIVLDSLGELMSFYQLSDYAFVGGSLVPIGGHNVLEPIAVHTPVFCGPYMQNSKEICDLLKKKEALIQGDLTHLINKLEQMVQNPSLKNQQATSAYQVFLSNKGTKARYLNEIELNIKNNK